MAYTPELSQKDSCTLRRIAWALDMPMTRAIEAMFEYVVGIIDRQKICVFCKDPSRCSCCAFNPQ